MEFPPFIQKRKVRAGTGIECSKDGPLICRAGAVE